MTDIDVPERKPERLAGDELGGLPSSELVTESVARRLFQLGESVALVATWPTSRPKRSWRSASPPMWDAYAPGLRDRSGPVNLRHR
jgi:hypothetical protein